MRAGATCPGERSNRRAKASNALRQRASRDSMRRAAPGPRVAKLRGRPFAWPTAAGWPVRGSARPFGEM
eukprot:1700293-Alexandrium_andersonii.AAC.1